MRRWKQQMPEGVQDFLPDECYNKRRIEEKLRKIFYKSGYDEIDTPMFEYLDVFSGSRASIEQSKCINFLSLAAESWYCALILQCL